MEDLLKEFLKQSPLAAALLTIVVIFIRYQMKRDSSHNNTIEKIAEKHDKVVESIINQYDQRTREFVEQARHFSDITEKGIGATEKNSAVLDDVKNTCGKLNETMTLCAQTQEFWKIKLQQG